LEYGIDRPGEMDFLLDIVKPHLGICTKLDAVHSMQFGNPEAIAEEELKMLRNTLETVFINEEEPAAMQIKNDLTIDTFSYQTENKKSASNIQVTENEIDRLSGDIRSSITTTSNGKAFEINTNII
jgi:UDP-N-acetylmuramoyl-tripeptide--D-alanyl-D-alanine ligase